MNCVKKLLAVKLILLLVAASAFIGENFPYGKPQICVDGEVYTMVDSPVSALPAGSEDIGALQGVRHHTASPPREDMYGANLDAKYAGCPLYRCGEDIYLYDYADFYIPFVK